MKYRYRLLLLAALSILSAPAFADYIKDTTRVINYGTTNGSILFQANQAGGMVSIETLQGPTQNAKFADGTVSNPAIIFTSPTDANTGIYHPAGNQVGFAGDGVEAGVFFGDGVTGGVRVGAGSLAHNSLSFLADNNTGFINPSDGVVRAVSNGTAIADISGTGVSVIGQVGADSFATTGGGTFKTDVYSFSSSSSNSGSAVATGGSYSTVLSMTATLCEGPTGFCWSSGYSSFLTKEVMVQYNRNINQIQVIWNGLGTNSKTIKAFVIYQ